MPTENPGIASADEVAAALAEAQSDPGNIPSLDDARRGVVPIPVEPPAVRSPRLRPGPPPAAPAPRPTPPAASPPAPAPASPAPEAPTPRRSRRWLQLVYRVLDAVLWAVNRPFEKQLSNETRRLVGIAAIVTLLIALATMIAAKCTRSPHTGEIPQLAVLRGAAQE